MKLNIINDILETVVELVVLLYALTRWEILIKNKRRSERTKAGLERARREGKQLGRPLGSKDKRKRKSKLTRQKTNDERRVDG